MRVVKVSSYFLACCMNEVTLGGHLRVRLVAGGINPVIRGLERSAPPLTSGEEESEVVLVITGQRVNESCLCNEVFIKTQKDGVERAPGLVNRWRFWVGYRTQSVEALHPLLTSPVRFFHLAAPEFCPFMVNW